MLTSKAEG